MTTCETCRYFEPKERSCYAEPPAPVCIGVSVRPNVDPDRRACRFHSERYIETAPVDTGSP